MKHQGICDDPDCPLKKFEQQAKARASELTIPKGQIYIDGKPFGEPVGVVEITDSSRSEEERRQRAKQP